MLSSAMALPGYSEAKRTTRVVDFEEQNYEELKRQHLREKSLFIDPKFPASDNSVQHHSHPNPPWKRPKEICKPLAPQFIREGMARTDVHQGKLADCWFLAAATSLTMHPKLLEHVVPRDQSFDTEDYAGIFHFRFWQFGQWLDVVVDDQLPCKNSSGENAQLLFGKSTEEDEFWMPLLEKAFAKLNGSYWAITGGFARDALVDLTGGIGEIVKLREIGPYFNLCKMIRNALDTNSLMGASIKKKIDRPSHRALNGLKMNHAYSITAVQKLTVRGKKMKLVRLQNPWGYKEWKGNWSDKDSKHWSKVDPEQREKLLVEKNDGEFWMDLRDFCTIFNRLHICYLSDEVPKEDATSFRWHSSCFQGRWKRANGDEPSDDLWMNPQFYMSLQELDEDGFTCTIISLMQRDQRRSRNKFLNIGIAVYEVTEEYVKLKDPAQRKEVLSDLKTERKTIYQKTEDCTDHFELFPGHYVIVPRVKSSEEGDFLLRVFTEKKHESLDISLDQKKP